MSYSCLEELQVDLDLHMPDKTSILYNAGCQYDDGWLIVTDDGICHLFDKNGNRDDITKIKQLEAKHIKKDIIKIIIPDSVTSIGDYVFDNCRILASATISDNMIHIGDGAFRDCASLTSITIPDNVTIIGPSTFSHCRSLTSVMIGNNVTCIWDYAFTNCHSLTSVTIGNNATIIGQYAFYGCNHLINLTFKNKTLEQVKKIDNYPWGIKNESIINIE